MGAGNVSIVKVGTTDAEKSELLEGSGIYECQAEAVLKRKDGLASSVETRESYTGPIIDNTDAVKVVPRPGVENTPGTFSPLGQHPWQKMLQK